jgi:TRAP-type transport system small permease protein
MSEAIKRLALFTRTMAGIFLGVMTLMIGTLIIGRYLSLSVPWADELARIFFVWACLLGASSGTNKRMHFSVSFFTGYLKEPVRKRLDFIMSILILCIMGLVFYVGIESFKVARIQTFPGLGISKIWMNIPIVIFPILVMVFTLEHIKTKFLVKFK